MRLRRPNFKYLATCATLDEAKKVYRQKAQELHPDKPTGNLTEMQQLNVEWDYIKNTKNIILPVEGTRSYGFTGTKTGRNSSFNAADMFSGFEAFKRYAQQAAEEEAARRNREEERVWSKAWKEQADRNIKKKQEAERPKTVNRTELDYDIAKIAIDALLEEAIELGKAKGSIYYSFVNFVKEGNYTTNRKQLEYMAIKLGYNSGWAYYKQEELKLKGLI